MRKLTVVAACLAAALVVVAAFAKDDAAVVSDVDIPLARGGALKATLHRPAKSNGFAVVLAPGQGYHRELPLMKRGAEALAEAGFVAVRFDWAYFTAKGQPAEDFATEVADVDAAIAFAKKQESVTKILLVGKSLGSVAALRWSNANEGSLAGLGLLTYPTTDPAKPESLYPGADELAKSALAPLILCGDNDPLAELHALYALAARPRKVPQVVIVPGDHGLTDGDKASAATAENVGLALQHLVVWAKRRVSAK
jgi:predicted alpha/beta-hydrolase family hydrolase